MVRLLAGVAGLLLAAGPALAQTGAAEIDWSAAGGDLFGRPAAEPVALAMGGAEPRLPDLSQPYMDAIARAADRHGLDRKLLHALVIVESAYRPDAVSPAGAGGLTQLMPGTAADLGVADRFDIEQNLSGGADYLARQLLRFGDLRLALAAYNAGPGAVLRYDGIPPYPETRNYVRSVMAAWRGAA